MSDNQNDIVSLLQQGANEPKDTSPNAGYVGTGDNGETIRLNDKPDQTKVVSSDSVKKQ